MTEQRELKFRAWDATFKRMKVTGMGINSGVLSGDDVIIMQSTGLLDWHGKEIYEGDIISANKNCLFDQGQQIQSVEFKNGSFIVSGSSVTLSTITDSFKPTIIGNIYETPELIGDRHD